MAFPLYRRSQVFLDNLGAPLAGGIVRFYEAGTTTPANVYSDEDLSVNLGSEETLDSAGRFATGIWGNVPYRARFYTVDETLVAEDDPVDDPAGAGTTIPSQSGHSGDVLSTNGSNLQWIEVETQLLPEMSGQSGKILSNDGEVPLWKTIVDLGFPTFDSTDNTTVLNVVLGTYRIQAGFGTFPVPSVTPPHGAALAVTFPTAFESSPFFYGAFGNDNNVATHDYKPVVSCEANATTLTVQYNINENITDSVADISSTVRFSWIAIGPA